ncbi:hypothetical protein WJX72_001636 [[Myrmecia] bisecta]|uniref:Alliinase C-terminal domain-containing protein n=1 Tax=[Myrmecia] bisecta TaxID=41462 RepID=A0AAW1Q3F6_9CHLO
MSSADVVEGINESWNGIIYAQSCSCYQCRAGPRCENEVMDCELDASSGTPLLFEDFWLNHPEAHTHIEAHDHLGYAFSHHPALESAIRGIHAMVGNAITEGREVVLGIGSSQLISAAMFALSTSGATNIYAEAPYYNAYKSYASFWNTSRFQWSGEVPDGNGSSIIEIITSPNNPDGRLRKPHIPGAKRIYDHAYYWPHYTPITGPVAYGDTDVALFTLSKLTGHAGSRVGWAIVTDPNVAERMRAFCTAAGGIVNENQLRAISVLEHTISTQGEIFEYGYQHMRGRWDRLQAIAAKSQRFVFQALEADQLDNWFGTRHAPSPAYVFVQCVDTVRDPDCYATLSSGPGGIKGRPGQLFGSTPDYVRLELLMRPEEFEVMATKLDRLAGQ